MSTPDLLQTPITTTVPDDVFYILKLVTSRLLTTGSSLGVGQTLAHLRDIFERDYIGVIKRKMDDVYRNSGPTSFSARPDKVEKENRVAFIVSACLFESTSLTEKFLSQIGSAERSRHFKFTSGAIDSRPCRKSTHQSAFPGRRTTWSEREFVITGQFVPQVEVLLESESDTVTQAPV